jgi:hypothetical protein
MWNALPQYTFIPNWLFYPLVFSFAIAFMDMVIWFGFLLIIEFLGIMIPAFFIAYYTHFFTFSAFLNLFKTITYINLSLSLFFITIDILWYFDLFPAIHALLTRTYWTSLEDRTRKKYEKKFKSQEKEANKEPAEQEPKTMHTKEELARLLNLWQQKYASANTDESRKEANKMILKYTTELERLKAKSGTTPERAKLTQGGDNE